MFFFNLFNKSLTKKKQKQKEYENLNNKKNDNKPNNMILKELITNFLLFVN